MSTYDFTHVDFSNSDIAESLGRAYKILLERALRRRRPVLDESNKIHSSVPVTDIVRAHEFDTADFQET